MPTKIKVAFSEAQKWCTSQTSVESDELSKDEVMELAVEVAKEAQGKAADMTMIKLR